MSSKPGSRDITLDVARGIAIVLLVYAHAIEIIFHGRSDGAWSSAAFVQWQFICAFDVPLFFLVSGASHRNIGRKTFREVAESSLRLIAMTFVVHLLGAVVLYFDRIGAWSDRDILRMSVMSMLKGTDFSTVVIWFLYALAIIQFLFYTAIRAKDLKPLWQRGAVWAVLAAIVLVGIVALLHPDMQSYLQVKAWVPGLLFFTIGYWMKRRGWAAPAAWLAVPLFGAVALLAPLNHGCTFSLTSVCPGSHLQGNFAVLVVTGSLGNWGMFVLTALIGSVGMLALSQIKFLAPFAYLGRNSLELFLINGFVVVFVNIPLLDVPVSEMGFGLGGVDIIFFTVVAQFLLLWLMRPLFAAFRTGTGWLAAQLIGVVNLFTPPSRRQNAGGS